MRVVVTGNTGQVVSALRAIGSGRENIDVIALGRPHLDLADPATILAALAAAKPDVVVSAAAYTAVDRAESEIDLCWRINAAGAGHVASAARVLDVPVIHLSTDYVFDGKKEGLWTEEDPVGPLGVYGASKLAGEFAVASSTENHVILRVAWVVSPFGNNFLKTMMRLALTSSVVRVVNDQEGTPTSAFSIAQAIFEVAENLMNSNDAMLRGLFHLAPRGRVTWAGFAEEIYESCKVLGLPFAIVTPISSNEFLTAAKRPSNSKLDSSLMLKTHGVDIGCWETPIRRVIEEVFASGRLQSV